MNDLSIIFAIAIGSLIGGIIFWQYKLEQSIKCERETNENLREEIRAMADRIHLLRQEKCVKKAEIIKESLGNGDWVQVLLILERNIEEHGRSTKHLSKFEKTLIKSASFFFSDLDTDSNTNAEKYLHWNICALELMKEHFLTILYPGKRHSKKDKDSEKTVTQSTSAVAVPGDHNWGCFIGVVIGKCVIDFFKNKHNCVKNKEDGK